MQKLSRPLFFGCLLTAVPMVLLDLPTGDSFPWFKRAAERILIPGNFIMAAITFGKLTMSSYYFAAGLNIAFYTCLALLISSLVRRLPFWGTSGGL